MGFAADYDTAVRTILVDDDAKDSKGNQIQRFLPFSFVTISGEDYIEVHSELPSANDGILPDQQVHQTTMPQRFTTIQQAAVDNTGSYNPTGIGFTALFEKHRGV